MRTRVLPALAAGLLLAGCGAPATTPAPKTPTTATAGVSPSAGPAAVPLPAPTAVPAGRTPFPGGLHPPAGTSPIGPSFAWPGTDGTTGTQLLLVTGDPYAVVRDLGRQFRAIGLTTRNDRPGCALGPLKALAETADRHRYLHCDLSGQRWHGPGALTSVEISMTVSPPGGTYQATMVIKAIEYHLSPADCARRQSEACATHAPRFVALATPSGRAPVQAGPAPAPPTRLGDPFSFPDGDAATPVRPGSTAAGPVHSGFGCSFGGYTAVVRDDGTDPALLSGYVEELTPGDLWELDAGGSSPTASTFARFGRTATIATSLGDDGARYVWLDTCGD